MPSAEELSTARDVGTVVQAPEHSKTRHENNRGADFKTSKNIIGNSTESFVKISFSVQHS